MKKLITFILFILFSTNLWAEIALYTTDNKEPHPMSDMYSILNKFSEDYPDRNILFYVHGRKKTMIEEWNKMPVLEDRYHIKVVMLHWDSYDTLITRPIENAMNTADELYEAFENVNRFRNDHQEFLQNRNINLLCHSMGNLVLKTTVERFLAGHENFNNKPLFTNYVSVGADVPLKEHREWLQEFHLASQNYIMMNNRDIVLLLSYLLDLKEHNPLSYKLGLGFDNYPAIKDQVKKKLDPTTKYVDLSDVLVSEHGYYMGKNAIMKTIFNRLLNGENFVTNSFTENSQEDFRVKTDKTEKNVYYIKKP